MSSGVSEFQVGELSRRGVSVEFAISLGVRSVRTAAELPTGAPARWSKWLPALLIPWRALDGSTEWQIRPDTRPLDENGKLIKYATRSRKEGYAPVLWVAKRGAEGGTRLFVEGTCQTLAAAEHAPADTWVIGMIGCRGWSSEKKPLADLNLTRGATAVVAFDADRTTNPDVRKAAEGLSKALSDAGAQSVRFIDLRANGKSGLDDVLGNVPAPDRATLLTDLMRQSAEATNPRTQAVLDAAFDANELDSLPEPEPLLEGVLNAREYVLLAGKFGTYKSFAALAWAYALATGKPWSGHTVPDPAPVVYVAAEGVSGIRKRLRALERHHGVKVPAGMLTVIARPVRLANPEEVAGIRTVIERRAARLVVLDTWHRMTPGIEENSATDTGGPLDIALQLRDDFEATVLVVHHTGHKQQHARGSSALEDDADAAWLIRLGDGEDAEDRGPATPRTLVQRKSKEGEIAEPVRLRLLVDDEDEAVVEADQFATLRTGRRGRPSKDDEHESAVRELIEAADADGLPADLGYRKLGEWDAARRPGRAATQRAVREAAIARKGLAATSSVSASAASPPKGGGDATQAPDTASESASEIPTQLSPAETLSASTASESLSGISDAPPDGTASREFLTHPEPGDAAPCPKCGEPMLPPAGGRSWWLCQSCKHYSFTRPERGAA